MPTRMIRDGILTSERINALSERAELFYRRLMSVVDDYGRFSANPTLLRSSCYPLKIDSVKEDSIKKHLAEAADAGLIVLYTVDGKAYLEIQDFGQRVQAKSKYPAPDEGLRDSTVIHGEARGKTAVVGGVVEGGGGGDARPRPPAAKRIRKVETPMPEDFGLSERVKAWAAEKGHTNLAAHLEAFRLKAAAKDYRYADWDSALMTAIREDWAKLGNQQKSTADHGGSPAAPRKRLGEGSSTNYGLPGIGRQGGEA